MGRASFHSPSIVLLLQAAAAGSRWTCSRPRSNSVSRIPFRFSDGPGWPFTLRGGGKGSCGVATCLQAVNEQEVANGLQFVATRNREKYADILFWRCASMWKSPSPPRCMPRCVWRDPELVYKVCQLNCPSTFQRIYLFIFHTEMRKLLDKIIKENGKNRQA